MNLLNFNRNGIGRTDLDAFATAHALVLIDPGHDSIRNGQGPKRTDLKTGPARDTVTLYHRFSNFFNSTFMSFFMMLHNEILSLMYFSTLASANISEGEGDVKWGEGILVVTLN